MLDDLIDEELKKEILELREDIERISCYFHGELEDARIRSYMGNSPRSSKPYKNGRATTPSVGEVSAIIRAVK